MKNPKKFLLITILLVVGIATRFIFLKNGESLLPNFTAVGAIAIFGAAYLKGWNKIIVPLGILWLSDIVLNNLVYAKYYDHFQVVGSLWVYASFIVAGLAAWKILKKASWTRLFGAGIAAGVVFYIITNLGVWMTSGAYPKTIAGLTECYVVALPFFRNTLAGNLFFGFALFGAYEWFASRTAEIDSLILKPNPV